MRATPYLVAGQLLLLAVGIALRFWNLEADIPRLQNADDLGDEGYWFIAARDLLRFGEIDRGSNFFQGLAGAPLSVATYAALAWLRGDVDYALVRGVSAFYSSAILVLGLLYFQLVKRRPLSGVLFLGLYGLLPLTLFYGRIAHLEQHLLFYLFLAFILVERATSPKLLAAAGFVAALAVGVKLVSVFVLPALLVYVALRHRANVVAALSHFALGAAPLLLALGAYLALGWSSFAETLLALASYHRSAGPFVDRFSIEYFWTHPLVLPYLPWLALGLALAPLRRDPTRTWAALWALGVLALLSLFRYQSYARHLLLFFPLLLLAASSLGDLEARLRSRAARGGLALACVAGLAASVGASTWAIGRGVFLEPAYTFRDAAQRLAAISNATDRVVGVHSFALSLLSDYRPRMWLNARSWRKIDPPARSRPTLALVATRFNGMDPDGRWARVFPRLDQFPVAERLDSIEYLDRFRVDVYRVFHDLDDYDTFLRLRQGRPSRYDGLLYNLYRNELESGCLVKAILVAESRGDPEISHRKISSTGCAGMMGFCYRTATEPMFSDLFQRLHREVRPPASDERVFQEDDRFDPEKSLRAGERYARWLWDRFAGLSDRERLVFAAYNGGPGLVSFLIRRSGDADPSWRDDLLPLLLANETSYYPGYQRLRAAERDWKFRIEIPGYVEDAYGTYEACSSGTRFEIAAPTSLTPTRSSAGSTPRSGPQPRRRVPRTSRRTARRPRVSRSRAGRRAPRGGSE